MTGVGNSQTPQFYEILINAAHPNDTHPVLSRLELELKEPFLLTNDESANIVQGEKGEFKPGDDITVNSGDTISWIVNTGPIDSILILHKEKGKNVFDSGPAPVLPGKNWSGIVRKVSKKEDEEYAICWSQGGKTYCYDPKITVNP